MAHCKYQITVGSVIIIRCRLGVKRGEKCSLARVVECIHRAQVKANRLYDFHNCMLES